jgi:alkanesulfonate monooxygenase SsuD/methylene tetrahydromethanopterin reductase-like flavin-dependent oxidoreductase (luciferase family)
MTPSSGLLMRMSGLFEPPEPTNRLIQDFAPELLDLFGRGDAMFAFRQDSMSAILGAPDTVVERLREYEQAGVLNGANIVKHLLF